MYSYPDDELSAALAALTRRRRLQLQRKRCLKIARSTFTTGIAGVIALCLWGLGSPAVAIPVALAIAALLSGAVSAALFARLARLSLDDADPDSDDDDRGSGGGGTGPPEPTGGGDLEFDWERFERDFRSYCDRRPAALPSWSC